MVSGRVFFPILVALSLAPAAVMTACAGQEEQAASHEQVAALQRSATQSRTAGTAKLVLMLEVPGSKGTPPLHFAGTGAIDFKDGRETLSMNVGGFMSEVIRDGTGTYSRMGMAGAPQGAGTWYRSEGATAAEALATSSFGVAIDDPALLVDMVTQAEDVRRAGREQVRGVAASHFTADTGGSEPIPFDVWLDAGGRVMRVRYSLPVSTTSGGEDAAPLATFTVDFVDYGSSVTITAPPAERVQMLPRQVAEASHPVLVGQK